MCAKPIIDMIPVVTNIKKVDEVTAEMVKLADNLWVDLNVALANELAKVCDKLGKESVPEGDEDPP